jgi:O-acetyl-ADP-ribose deacetylase (regulator of RNase III)
MDVTARSGDIVEQDAEAIASSSGRHLQMRSGTARSIRLACDGPIRDDIAANAPAEGGDVVVTDGYNIAEYILHAVTSTSERAPGEVIPEATRNTLEKANNRGCQSLALPILGTGHRQLSFQDGVRLIGETIETHHSDSLETVELVCYTPTDEFVTRRLFNQTAQPWKNRSVDIDEIENRNHLLKGHQ